MSYATSTGPCVVWPGSRLVEAATGVWPEEDHGYCVSGRVSGLPGSTQPAA
jgi:hypothetical protein